MKLPPPASARSSSTAAGPNESTDAWDDLFRSRSALATHRPWRRDALLRRRVGTGAALAGSGISEFPFAGNLTYPKAQPLRDVAARLPLDGVLVETDAPWLAPAPDRGKRNEPAWVVRTASVLAEVMGVEMQEIASATTKSFARLFHLPPGMGN